MFRFTEKSSSEAYSQYLAKNYTNQTNIIFNFNPGVLAAIYVAGVCGDPCGAVCQTAVQRIAPQGSPRTPTACIAATTPELIVGILNSVFFRFFKFLNIQ